MSTVSPRREGSPMEVRKYDPADRDALLDLWRRVFPDDPPHNAPDSVLAAKLAVDDLVFVAVEDGQLVGACMAGYDGHRGWLYAVAVDPKRRLAGTGSRLVSRAISELREQGCIKVNIQVRTGNQEVVRFYRKHGFDMEERISMGKLLE